MKHASRLAVVVLTIVAATAWGGCKRVQPAIPATGDCGEPIAGADALVQSAELVLFGEAHGTTEIPRFVADIACLAAAKGRAVKVGLEISSDDQAPITRYLASAGTSADRATILATPFWNVTDPDFADGRSSVAMLDLIERMRRLRQSGAEVDVFAFGAGKWDRHERDYMMAVNVRQVQALAEGDLVLALAGIGHVQSTVASRNTASMAWYLRHQHGLAFVALGWKQAGGSAWMPNAAGYVGPVWDAGDACGRSIELEEGPDGLHGTFCVGQVTPSRPAALAHRPSSPP